MQRDYDPQVGRYVESDPVGHRRAPSYRALQRATVSHRKRNRTVRDTPCLEKCMYRRKPFPSCKPCSRLGQRLAGTAATRRETAAVQSMVQPSWELSNDQAHAAGSCANLTPPRSIKTSLG